MTGAALPEVELAPGALAIADLHLDLGAEPGGRAFARWLDALEAPELVVLGDLFDVWVGPAQAVLPGAPAVLDALAGLAARGVGLAVVHGNRDFLLGGWFARRTGARLYPRGFVGRAGGARVVCVHGDELCTLDRGYQRLRAVVRSRPVGWVAPRLPLAVAGRLALRLRRASTRAVEAKPAAEKSMQPDAAEALAALHGADALVCGHAHAYRDERLAGGARWIVLDAFGGPRDVCAVGAGGELRVTSSARRAGAGPGPRGAGP
jgi:UDP-2,3-diacylglucosamine hydrolase